MKKVFVFSALIFCIGMVVFPQEEAQPSQAKPSFLQKDFQMDMWFTVGAAFGNYFFYGKQAADDHIGSPGINLSYYSLFGPKKIGIFFNYGILFPVIYSSGQNYDASVQLDFILIGFGYGYDFNESLKLHLGIGPHLSFLNLSDSVDSKTKVTNNTLGLGLGGDVGVKYNITKYVCVDLGAALTCNFAVFNEISREVKGNDGWQQRKTESSSWNNINSIIGIKPYIAVGVNVNNAMLKKN